MALLTRSLEHTSAFRYRHNSTAKCQAVEKDQLQLIATDLDRPGFQILGGIRTHYRENGESLPPFLSSQQLKQVLQNPSNVLHEVLTKYVPKTVGLLMGPHTRGIDPGEQFARALEEKDRCHTAS